MTLHFDENIVGYHREFEQVLILRLPENIKVNLNSIPE
jgi:predicted nucleotidyltransferase